MIVTRVPPHDASGRPRDALARQPHIRHHEREEGADAGLLTYGCPPQPPHGGWSIGGCYGGPVFAGHGTEENMIRSKRVTLLAGSWWPSALPSAVWAARSRRTRVLGCTPAVPTRLYRARRGARRADMPMGDKTVTVQTQWITAEGDDFSAALEPFRTATGIDVRVAEVPSGQHEQLVNVSLNGGVAADIITLAQPSTINAYGAQGLIKDVNTLMDGEKLAAEHAADRAVCTRPATRSGASPTRSTSSRPCGIPSRPSRPRATRSPRRGTSSSPSPTRSSPMAASPGATPRSRPRATGWITTDWIEDILLRTAGKEFYDKWTTHERRSPRPRSSAPSTSLARCSSPTATSRAAAPGILATSFLDAMDPMFNDDLANPGCWMQKQATWYGPTQFPDVKAAGGGDSKYVIGEDVGIFYFPPIDEAMGTPVARRRRRADGHPGSARGPGAGPVPVAPGGNPGLGRARQRGLGQLRPPRPSGTRASTSRKWPRTSWPRRPRSRFDASDLMPASGLAFWHGVVEWLQRRWHQHRRGAGGHRR